MLYITGTIVRNDGKRMTRKRADAVFDAFLGWLEDKQGCLFGGCFNPAYKDNGHVVTANTMSGPVIDLKWDMMPKKLKTRKRKKPKRKTKR